MAIDDRRRSYERDAACIGHPTPVFCPVCGDVFTLDEWSDRHDHDESVYGCHAACCEACFPPEDAA